jgi:hypothetical protein
MRSRSDQIERTREVTSEDVLGRSLWEVRCSPKSTKANPADQQIAGGVLITNELDDIDGVPGAPKSLASKCVSGQVKKSLIHDSISSKE